MPENKEETGIVINNQKVKRDECGRFVKGTACPNPSGRPKSADFRQRLNELVGGDSRELALLLCEIAFYDPKNHKHAWAKWKPAERLKALELILKYKESPAPSKLEIEQKSVIVTAKLPDDMELEDLN